MLELAYLNQTALKELYARAITRTEFKYYFIEPYLKYDLTIENTEWRRIQYVSKDTGGRLLGYLGASVGRAHNIIENLELINFTGNAHITFSRDVIAFFELLLCKRRFRKIIIKPLAANPRIKMYRKYCLDNRRIKYRTTLNMVIAPNNVDYLSENLKFIHQLLDGKNISMNIAVEQDWDDRTLTILERELNIVADFYVQILTTADPDFYIRLIDDQIKRSLANSVFTPNKCGAAKTSFVINTNGDIYGCGGFSFTGIKEEDIVIGNIRTGINPVLQKRFWDKAFAFPNTGCNDCAFINKCFNYCPANNYLGSKSMTEVSCHHCEINKRLIQAADRIIDILYSNHYDLFRKKFYQEAVKKEPAGIKV